MSSHEKQQMYLSWRLSVNVVLEENVRQLEAAAGIPRGMSFIEPNKPTTFAVRRPADPRWLDRQVDFLAIRCPGDVPPCQLAGLLRLTWAATDVFGLISATVDGFSDCSDLPADASAALQRLRALAADRHASAPRRGGFLRAVRPEAPTNMAVEVELRGTDREVVTAFAPYSIHAELVDESGAVLLVLHDSGTAVSLSVAKPALVGPALELLDQEEAAFERRD